MLYQEQLKMDLQLKNIRVMITGSTGSFGEGIAKRFAQARATVIINGRRKVEAKHVAEEIQTCWFLTFIQTKSTPVL
jgi:NADP-dependent 3-hydroxy acid dehydrogenase YdfG